MTVMDNDNELMRLVIEGNSREVLNLFHTIDVAEEDLNKPDKNGRTCLSYTASSGDVVMADLLLATDLVDPNLADTEGNTPLIYSVSLGHSMMLMKLLKYPHTQIDQSNKSGFTALMKAAIHGHQTCLELLLKAGANVEMTDFTRNMTALQWAKLCGSQDCVKLLRKYKSHTKGSGKSVCKLSRSASDLTNTPIRHQSKPLIKKIKSTIGQQKNSTKSYLGVEGIVSCASTPAIPLLVAYSNNNDSSECLVSPLLPRKLCNKTAKGKLNEIGVLPPMIEITSETGENIEPNKHVYSSSITKRHQQLS